VLIKNAYACTYTLFSFNRIVPRALHIALEGVVGCGKTTLARQFAQFCDQQYSVKFKLYEEPVAEWRSFGVHETNLLELMYDFPRAYSFEFQMAALLTKCEQLRDFTKYRQPNILVERTIACQEVIFVPLLQENNGLSNSQYEILQRFMTYQIDMTKLSPDVYIYLRTTPELAKQRIEQRGRPEEQALSMWYITNLHKRYEQWFDRVDGIGSAENVFIVDATKPIKMHQLFTDIWNWAIHNDRLDALVYPWF
jgi:deoxynucleoside kinase